MRKIKKIREMKENYIGKIRGFKWKKEKNWEK